MTVNTVTFKPMASASMAMAASVNVRSRRNRRSVKQVVEEAVKPCHPTGVAMRVFRGFDRAERLERQPAGFCFGHPAPHIVVDGQIKVRLGFLVELAVQGIPVKQGNEAGSGLLEDAHSLPPAVAAAITRSITAASRSHCDLSAFIWRTPALVID